MLSTLRRRHSSAWNVADETPAADCVMLLCDVAYRERMEVRAER